MNGSTVVRGLISDYKAPVGSATLLWSHSLRVGCDEKETGALLLLFYSLPPSIYKTTTLCSFCCFWIDYSIQVFFRKMNGIKQLFARLASNIPNAPQGAPAGGGKALSSLVFMGLGVYGAYHSMVTIQPGHAGIVYSRIGGLEEKIVLHEGLNFVIPWLQRAVVYDIRTRPQPIDTQSGSKGNVFK